MCPLTSRSFALGFVVPATWVVGACLAFCGTKCCGYEAQSRRRGVL